MSETDFKDVIWDYITKTYGSQARAARHWDVSDAYISAVVSGRKTPPKWLLKEMGYRKQRIVTETFIALGESFKAGFRPTSARLDSIAGKGNELIQGANDNDLGESDA